MSPILEMQYIDCKRFVALRCVRGTTQPAFYNRRTRGLLRGSPPHRETPNPKRVGSVWDWGALRFSRGDGPSGSSDYFAMSSVPLTSSLFMELLAFDTSILLPSFIVKT